MQGTLSEQEWELVREIIAYLKKDYRYVVPTEGILQKFPLSRTRLYSLFKTAFNQSFYDHYTALRMEESKRLLEETGKDLQQIARLTGYPHTSTFTRRFAQHYGYTPHQWRIRNRKKYKHRNKENR